MKFQNAKIYKIVCNVTGSQYIGSTVKPLYKRLSEHKAMYKRYITGKSNAKLSSFEILKSGDFTIELVIDYPCNCKTELLQKEREFVDSIECINKNRPFVSDEEKQREKIEKLLQFKERVRAYYELLELEFITLINT